MPRRTRSGLQRSRDSDVVDCGTTLLAESREYYTERPQHAFARNPPHRRDEPFDDDGLHRLHDRDPRSLHDAVLVRLRCPA